MNSQAEIIAHRGGLWPGVSENTLEAFTRAHKAGVTWMETDVHSSADGILFAAHDADLARIAGLERRIRDLQARDLDRIELAAGGRLPRLSRLFEALPNARWNIDVKEPHSVAATIRTLRRLGAEDRVRLAAFQSATLRRLRAALPGTPTSAGIGEAARFAFVPGSGVPVGVDALQVPTTFRGVPVVTSRFVKRAHRAGLEVHVWTINRAAAMRLLVQRGVDAIITDDVPLAVETLGRHCTGE